ncbi:MAG: glutamate decarboxylase [Gammaproteobacteria bacterium]|nr:glutamate decarboxylase [Gammaproteobacteria bacterium]
MDKNLEILRRAVARWQSKDGPAGPALDAKDLQAVYDVSLGETGGDITELEHAINHYLDYSPDSSHPEFFKLLYSGVNEPAVLGDWVTALANATMHTYQVGPVATLMELELIRQWNALIGFKDGEGVMVSGGSQANMLGLMLARHRAAPELKNCGFATLSKPPVLVAYTSDQSHYSYQRAVNILGVGQDNLVKVASNDAGEIYPQALEEAIKADIKLGKRPFFLGLTAGTTVSGAYDDIKACSDVAKGHDVWLHIDGAWGGPALFSPTHKQLLSNSELADSFAWDAHKLMNVPITAGAILVKQSGQLKDACAGGGGEYLFHQDANAEFNLGERSIQCGRRADALKVWLSWKARGHRGFAEKIDHLQAMKARCVGLIGEHPELEMLAPAPWLNVLFRNRPAGDHSEEELAKLNQDICRRIKQDGGPYVDYARYKGRLGIRLIIANELTSEAHLQKLINLIMERQRK